jgi:hypothetical protein
VLQHKQQRVNNVFDSKETKQAGRKKRISFNYSCLGSCRKGCRLAAKKAHRTQFGGAELQAGIFLQSFLTSAFTFVIIVGFALKGEELLPSGSIASGLQCGRRAQD